MAHSAVSSELPGPGDVCPISVIAISPGAHVHLTEPVKTCNLQTTSQKSQTTSTTTGEAEGWGKTAPLAGCWTVCSPSCHWDQVEGVELEILETCSGHGAGGRIQPLRITPRQPFNQSPLLLIFPHVF